MNELVDWVYAHPRYGYLIAGVLLLFWLFGVIRGWKWTYEANSRGQNTFRELFGERGRRFCVAGLLVVALVATVYLFFSAPETREEPYPPAETPDTRPLPAEEPLPTDPSFQRIMELPLHEALPVYGETIEGYIGKDREFTMGDNDSRMSEFRIGLFNIYKPELYESTVIRIKEVTWRYAAGEKITVWYERQKDNTYIPKDSYIYSDDTEF